MDKQLMTLIPTNKISFFFNLANAYVADLQELREEPDGLSNTNAGNKTCLNCECVARRVKIISLRV